MHQTQNPQNNPSQLDIQQANNPVEARRTLMDRLQGSKLARAGALILVSAGLSIGTFGVDSAEAQTRRIDSTELATSDGFKLPPIDKKGWVEGGDSSNIEELASATYLGGDYQISFSDKLPKPYQKAFRQSLESPIVKYAIESGKVSAINVQNSEDSDYGYFLPKDKSITIELGAGKEERVFVDSRVVTAVVVHETMHGVSEQWYRPMEDGMVPANPILAKKIERIDQACRVIRDDAFKDFITANRAELAFSYKESANRFLVDAEQLRLDANPTNDAEIPKLQSYKDYMLKTSSEIENNNPEIYTLFNQSRCNFDDIFDIALSAVEKTDDKKALWALYDNSGMQPLASLDHRLESIGEKRTKPLKDSKAIKDLIGSKKNIDVGHAFENPSEAAASLMTNLYINPGYVEKELDKFSPQNRANLEALMAAIIDITDPEVIEIVRANKDAAKLIDSLSKGS